ncbi:MAG: cytochrome c biogenesis protein ResB [Spirochaetes bacterium]|nr:cytochrome c biogenesis protein ResB [Spirochaetota bacterium]
MKNINRTLKYFRSMRFGAILISTFIFFFITGSIIPQNQTNEIYLSLYPDFISDIIIFLGFNDIYRSFIFIFLSFLFILNLSYCSVYRIFKNIKIKKNYYGPDIIHIGLLVIIIGGLISSIARTEDYIVALEGDSIKISDDITIIVDDIEKITYPDGSPKSYQTNVSISVNGRITKKSIKVNSPLTISGVTAYQNNYGLTEFNKEYTGIKFIKDNGDIFIYIGIILIGAGLILTYLKKLREVN